MQHILSALVSAMVSGLGYLVSRWLARSRADETLRRRLRVMTLHRAMKKAGMDSTTLREVERELSSD